MSWSGSTLRCSRCAGFASPELARPRISHAGVDIELSTMLVVDAIARSEPGEVSVRLVADSLQVAPSTASRLVERAVQAGMVAGTSSENDPRVRVLHLTREGRRLQRAAPGTAHSASPTPPPTGPAPTSPVRPPARPLRPHRPPAPLRQHRPVNITVLGATGRTGRPLVEELLTRGHHVTALVRDPTTYAAPDGVTVVAGHSRDAAALAAAVAGADAVVSALGPVQKDGTLHQDTARALVPVMTEQGVQRFVGVSEVLR